MNRLCVTPDKLNSVMESDHVIRVHDDATVSDEPGVYAPEIYNVVTMDDFQNDIWELLNGWSGQDGYAGPIMHDSEYIGGALAKYILETPGVYVVCAAYYNTEENDEESFIEGWAIATRKDSDDAYEASLATCPNHGQHPKGDPCPACEEHATLESILPR